MYDTVEAGESEVPDLTCTDERTSERTPTTNDSNVRTLFIGFKLSLFIQKSTSLISIRHILCVPVQCGRAEAVCRSRCTLYVCVCVCQNVICTVRSETYQTQDNVIMMLSRSFFLFVSLPPSPSPSPSLPSSSSLHT